MKYTSSHVSAREYIDGLAAKGRYHFVSSDVQAALGVSAAAAKLALNRLAKQKILASPQRGFYVIVPPEYRALGCLPADQFVPELMKRTSLAYYAGLLTAAQYHGAAHHRPQEFQVVLSKPRPLIQCGAVRVAFVVRKRVAEVPVQSFNTQRGTISVSTPEATALDLVGYQHQVGGLDQVATVLAELAERIDPEKLVSAAALSPVAWAQRLGYLMEKVEAADKVLPLKAYVLKHARLFSPLLPGEPHTESPRVKDWKLYINTDVEPDL